MLTSRLPDSCKRIAMLCGHALMLYIPWLLFSGSLQQARINLDVRAPVTGASVAIFYCAGVVFSVFAALILVHELWLVATGRMKGDDFILVKESEEQAQLEAINGLFQADKRRARGYGCLDTIKTVIFMIAGKLDFKAINPHAGQPT